MFENADRSTADPRNRLVPYLFVFVIVKQELFIRKKII